MRRGTRVSFYDVFTKKTHVGTIEDGPVWFSASKSEEPSYWARLYTPWPKLSEGYVVLFDNSVVDIWGECKKSMILSTDVLVEVKE